MASASYRMRRRCGDAVAMATWGGGAPFAAFLNEERDGACGTARVLDHNQRVAAFERADERPDRTQSATQADGEHGYFLASATLGRDVLDELRAEVVLAAPAFFLGVIDEQEVIVVRIERG